MKRFWFVLLFAVTARAAEDPLTIRFTNKVETFQTVRGEQFQNVALESASPNGLIWAATNNPLKTGRVPIAELSQGTRERLGVPEYFLGVKAERENAALRARIAIAEAQEKAKRPAEDDLKTKANRLIESAQKTGVIVKMEDSGVGIDIWAGDAFFEIPFDMKKTIAQAVLVVSPYAEKKYPVIRFKDNRSGKEVASLTPFGFSVK